MTTVTFTAGLPGDAPHEYRKILVVLVDGGAGASDGEKVIGGTRVVKLDEDGTGALVLEDNDSITPAGTFYRATLDGASPPLVRCFSLASDTVSPVSWADPTIQVEAPVPPSFAASVDGAIADAAAAVAAVDGKEDVGVAAALVEPVAAAVDTKEDVGVALDLVAAPPLAGGIGLHAPSLADFHALLEGAKTSPFDVVIFNDSLDSGAVSSPPWTWRFGEHLARATSTPTPSIRQGMVFAKASGHPTMDTCEGTLSATTLAGWGATMTNGQTATHTVYCDAFSVVYKAGAGSIEVRDGATLLATIDTTLVSGASNVWTSAALSLATRTITLTSVGATTIEALQPHLGTRTKGARVWGVSHSGWGSDDYVTPTSHGLDLVTNLAPEVVIIETGTNAAPTYAADIAALVAAVQAASPTSLVVCIVPATSFAIDQAEVDAGRAVIEGLGVPIIDWDRLLPDYGSNLITDGIHPTTLGAQAMADVTWAALGGDPIGQLVRARSAPTRTETLELAGASATDLRLRSGWKNITEGGDNIPIMDLLHADGLIISTPGDGHIVIDGAGNQPRIGVYAVSEDPEPSITFGTVFSAPTVAFGNGDTAPNTFLSALAGVLRVGLDGLGALAAGSLALGNETLALTVEADSGDGSTDRLNISGETRIETPGDGYILFRTVLNQPVAQFYASPTATEPVLTVGAIFSAPFISFGAGGSTAPASFLTGGAGNIIKSGLSAEGQFQGGHLQTINAQTGTTYTVVAADAARQITRNNASASTQTWATPTSLGIAVGTRIHVGNKGAGTVTHSGGGAAGALTQASNTEIVAVADTTTTWRLYS